MRKCIQNEGQWQQDLRYKVFGSSLMKPPQVVGGETQDVDLCEVWANVH